MNDSMKNSVLYVANWKMNSSFEDSLMFYTHNKEQLVTLTTHYDTTIVLCPSFPVLHLLADLFKNTSVYIGAQNCSDHVKGAYTSQVDALSLAQAGCTYCIIGHSEARNYLHETDEQIGQKLINLCKQGIRPIVCVGETRDEYENGHTYTVLERQLQPICQSLKQCGNHVYYIAYEPIWAIGTGDTPSYAYIEQVFSWIREYCTQRLPDTGVHMLYGGSVDEHNIADLKKIEGINGFLIGTASLDFQKLQKIIVCTY
jgi:triosephosphate isomerase